MKFHKAGLLVMALILLTGWSGKAWAGDEDETDLITGAKTTDFIKERSYIGVVGTSADIDQWGDFNGDNGFEFFPAPVTGSGSTTATTYPEVDFIPSITREFGWGVMLGHREGPWAAELSFWRSDHTASMPLAAAVFAGGVTSCRATLQAINFDLKRYFFTQLPVQPFIDLGMSFPWLWVQQGSYIDNPSGVTINDETISGIGMNLGAGVELYLDNNFSIVGGLYQRWGEFSQINGAEKIPLNQMYFDGNPNDRGAISGDGLNVYVGTTFGVQ